MLEVCAEYKTRDVVVPRATWYRCKSVHAVYTYSLIMYCYCSFYVQCGTVYVLLCLGNPF